MPNIALPFLFDNGIAFRRIGTGWAYTLLCSWERIGALVAGYLVYQPANRLRQTLNPPKEYGPAVGQPALDFTADALDGCLVLLSDYLGKAVVLLAVAPCWPESRAVLLAYAAAEVQIKAAGRQIVVVSLGDDDETHHWAKELDLKIPIIVAPERTNSFKRDYRIPGAPFFCVLDADGRVQARGYASADHVPVLEL